MNKRLICTECPVGCVLSITVYGKKVTEITGNKCPRGEKYAKEEVENPVRIVTSTVKAENLSLKFMPVRTDKPIPKAMIKDVMKEIQKVRVQKSVNIGAVIVKNILNLDTNLIATRDCPLK